MQNKEALPANQEPAVNPKKTWQEPELINLSVMGGNIVNYTEILHGTIS